MIKAIFLDRDGVINIDTGYISKIEEFIFVDGIFESCKEFQKLGYKIFIITNQSGINRGYFTKDDFLKLSIWMINEFKNKEIEIQKIYFCPHSPKENCKCRKPKPKMVLDAKEDFNIDLKNSWFIGDKTSDMECAINAGIDNLILINSNYNKDENNYKTVNNINEAKDEILKGKN